MTRKTTDRVFALVALILIGAVWLTSAVRTRSDLIPIVRQTVPGNARALWAFRFQVGRLWWRTLKRRSQRSRWNWIRMTRLINRWLPCPRILHPYPEQRLRVITRGRSPMR